MKRVLFLSLTLAACGSDDEGGGLTGTYEVTSHTLSEEGCNDPKPVEDASSCFSCAVEKAFFKVKRQTIFGETITSMVDCVDAETCDDANDDPDTINLTGPIFDQKDGDTLIGEVKGALYSAKCSYTYVKYELTPTENGVQLTRTESRMREDSMLADLGEDECFDLVDAPVPTSELNCKEKEIAIGVLPE